jgi:hypothetical protein
LKAPGSGIRQAAGRPCPAPLSDVPASDLDEPTVGRNAIDMSQCPGPPFLHDSIRFKADRERSSPLRFHPGAFVFHRSSATVMQDRLDHTRGRTAGPTAADEVEPVRRGWRASGIGGDPQEPGLDPYEDQGRHGHL